MSLPAGGDDGTTGGPGRAPRVRVRSTDPAPPGGAPVPGDGAPSDRAERTDPERPGDLRRRGRRTAGPPDAADDGAVYARSLARAQLRLALACAGTFLVAILLLTLLVTTTRALDDVVLLGVPLPWLVHAYGYYPVIVAFAVVFAVAAARNERRFRALAEPDDPAGDDE